MAVCTYTPITDWLGEALIKYSQMVSEMKYHKDNFPFQYEMEKNVLILLWFGIKHG